ncbi:ATP-binding protein [Alkalicella caledoniensis]|uniref:histidine kinase n=1 Tax=Alkalicella caledoniensis TaxID=2731377 RepID=A0A7G9W4M3_ALKCA|nr:ATP-binding protein [Alkalicella caledoniensis]QNO13635.1 ATP-binding protein [Alkalicella caledoniensis]
MQDISQIILDLVQNSIAADSTKVQIEIKKDILRNLLIITINDNGKGMSQEITKGCTDPFYTTRTTRSVGLGLAFTKMLSEQSGGFFNIDSQENQGTRLNFSFLLNHWDRPPFGKLEDTYISLLILNPNVEFNISISTDEKSFTLKSQDVYENIGESHVSEAWVIEWLREYLRENFYHLLKEEDKS